MLIFAILVLVKKIIVIFIILTSIALLTGFFIFNSSQKKLSESEKEKALIKILGRKPNLSENEVSGEVEYKGKYASFKYPAKAKIYTYKDPNMTKNTSVLETFSFDIDKPRLVFNFSVMENAASLKDVNDISGVKLRQISGLGYAQSEQIVGGESGLIFVRSGNLSEKTGFFLAKDKIYSVAITGSSLKEVSLLFDLVINSFVFF